jgi:hypothetical protein
LNKLKKDSIPKSKKEKSQGSTKLKEATTCKINRIYINTARVLALTKQKWIGQKRKN